MIKIKNYIDGKWIESKTDKFLRTDNPGIGEVLARVPVSTEEEIEWALSRQLRRLFQNGEKPQP